MSSDEQSKLLELRKKEREHPCLSEISDKTALRFLKHRSYDVDKALSLLEADHNWRLNMDLKHLNISHVQEQMRTAKFVIPGTFDKEGRAIIIFNAGKHHPSTNFMEMLQLAVYGFELALKSLPDDVEELLIIENLDGFSKDNADNRMVKYLLEVVQDHYPGRIGKFVAVNAPWYYRLLFKVVKPWLSDDLLSKVNIYSDTSDLKNFVTQENLPKELGGTKDFDIAKWVKERADIEGVDLSSPSPLHVAPQIVAAFSDLPMEAVMKQAIKSGWMKKQGGYVRKFNKRYCVLTETIFYYYKEENGSKPEGFVELLGATVTPKNGSIFYITTAVNKVCVFNTSAKEYNEWLQVITNTIQNLTETEDVVLKKKSYGDLTVDSLRRTAPGYNFDDDNVSKFLFKDPTELSRVIKKAKGANGVKKTKHDEFGDCVLGADLIAWLLETTVAQSKSASKSVGQLMLDEYQLFPTDAPEPFDEDKLYYFLDTSKPFSLNSIAGSQDALEDPISLRRSLQNFLTDIILQQEPKGLLREEAVLAIQQRLDYREFCSGVSQLHSVDVAVLSPAETTLFLIQLFNLLNMHTFVAMYHSLNDSVEKDIGCSTASYDIGEKRVSLKDFEMILRGQNEAPQFGVEGFDARSLFAMRPGYWSNEYPYQVDYTGTLEEALQLAAESFVMKNFQYDKKKKQVVVPAMMQWYLNDFGGSDQQMLATCSAFVRSKSWLKSWKSVLSSSPKVIYKEYKRDGLRFIPSQ